MVKKSFFSYLIETGQFKIDNEGHAMLLGEYLILVPAGILFYLQETLGNEFGEDKAKEIITNLGETQTELAAKRYLKRFKLQKVDKRKIAELGIKIDNMLGWGNIIVDKLSFTDKTARVILKNSVLSLKYKEMYGKTSNKPIDHWLAGILKKHFSVIFETDVEIKEVKCLAMGDPYCEFIVKPKS